MEQNLVNVFKQKFNAEPTYTYSAAGRVNLIGEHIDYCGGKVLPCALSLKCTVLVRKNGTNFMRIAATTIDATAEIDLTNTENYKDLKWGNYQAGVANELVKAGYNLVGVDILYHCTVPFGSGLSSSAAIEVATAYALLKTSDNKIDKREISIIAKNAENNYCGVNCGIMDQFASANGQKGKAMLLDCQEITCEQIPLELGDYALVLANCKKPHDLRESKYNERREETEKALSIISKKYNYKNLSSVPFSVVEEFKDQLGEVVYKRAKHVATESQRVNSAVDYLKSGDLISFGQLMIQSHLSLKDDYEVTGKELDALFFAAKDQQGCIGTRMTGAGFGGCTVSLVKKDLINKFIENVKSEYKEKTGYTAEFYVAEPEEGIIG